MRTGLNFELVEYLPKKGHIILNSTETYNIPKNTPTIEDITARRYLDGKPVISLDKCIEFVDSHLMDETEPSSLIITLNFEETNKRITPKRIEKYFRQNCTIKSLWWKINSCRLSQSTPGYYKTGDINIYTRSVDLEIYTFQIIMESEHLESHSFYRIQDFYRYIFILRNLKLL